VEVNNDPERSPLRNNLKGICKSEIRINDRIKSFPVFRLIWVLHTNADLLLVAVYDTRSYLRNGLPLPGCGFKPKVAVGSNPKSVLNYSYTTLVALRIEIMSEHYVEPGHFQIVLIIDTQHLILGIGCQHAHRCDGAKHDSFHSSFS